MEIIKLLTIKNKEIMLYTSKIKEEKRVNKILSLAIIITIIALVITGLILGGAKM